MSNPIRAQRPLSPVAALGVVVTVLLTVTAAMILLFGGPSEQPSVLAADGGDPDDATSQESEPPAFDVLPEAALEVALTRDPFEPVRPAETTQQTNDDNAADQNDANGTDPDDPDPVAGEEIRVVLVRSDSAIIEIDGTAYDVMVGDVFASTYRLLRIVGDCVELQRGDQVLPVLCAGDSVTK